MSLGGWNQDADKYQKVSFAYYDLFITYAD